MKTVTEIHQGYDKAKSIINSCETTEQLVGARQYVKLFTRFFSPQFNGVHPMSTNYLELSYKVRNMEIELKNVVSYKNGEILRNWNKNRKI